MNEPEPVHFCPHCRRAFHATQVANAIGLALTKEEAALTNHAIGYLLIALMREGGAANDARIGALSGIAVRLQFAKEGITP